MPTDTPRIRDIARTVGLRLREQDVDALSRWTAARVQALALPAIEQYIELLAQDQAAGRRERELLIAQFSTGESYFFRDLGQFELLAETILPELIARRAGERRLRLWSAGCAAGEEAYSLAMLVDASAPRLSGWNISILGTDINNQSLEKARRGIYGDWAFRALDAERKQRYFQRRGHRWRVDERLRNMVSFRCGDLVRDEFPDAAAGLADFDLILCRNVLIYLDAHAVARITAKFAATLADGGCLITGHSELFGHDTAPLRVRMYAQSAVYQKTTAPAAETVRVRAPAQVQASLPASPLLSQPKGTIPRIEQASAPALATTAPAEACDRLMQAARRHADRGMPEAAEQDCRNAITLDALDARPYYLLAQLAQERAAPAEAKRLLNKVVYLDPSFIAAYLDLAALHAQNGELERSRRMYESARTALRKLPAQAEVAPYSDSTAADVLAHVERMLGRPGAGTPACVAAQALSQQSA